ncbi:MAG: hypothetical protein KJT03_02295 [Verrucomicrobiae bacterium]|nr:hypothetical protein [Verrucomicrobiae bacterium]
MQTLTVEDQLAQIQASLSDIQEELSIIRRTRDEIQDLKEDMSIVVKDVFKTLVEEMEEISPYINNGELVDLLKRVVRNIGGFNKLLMQLESVEDFITDATPLGKQVFNDAIAQLHEFQEKGYFDYVREAGKIVENVTANFSPEDVRLLSENVVSILLTVKNLTQPDMLKAVNNAAMIFKHLDPAEIEEYSLWRVIREVNSSEMRRAWGLFYTFLKNLSQAHQETISTNTPK